MAGDQSNPLIAEVEDSTEWYTGISLVESVTDVGQAISSGSWVEAGLGMAAIGAEAASLVIDPFGTLAGFGVGFLIEHVEPLQEALNWVAGDPDQITAYAQTWKNVSSSLEDTAAAHKSAVDADITSWTGATASAYRARAAQTSDALNAAAAAASSAASAIEMAGAIVSAVRITVRDIVAQTVGRLAVWAAEAVFSLGVATPLVAAQAATYVAKTMTTISRLFSKLAKTMSQLTPLLARLKGVWQAIVRTLSKSGKSTPAGAPKNRSVDTTTKPSNADTPSSTDTPTKPTDTSTKPAGTDTPTKPSSTDTPSKSTDSPSKTDTTPSKTDTTPSSTDTPSSKPSSDKPTDRSKSDDGVGDDAKKDGPKNTQDDKDVTECNDPVDVATGEFLLPETDLTLPGVLPLVLLRRHRSDYRYGRWFGPSWSATLDMRVVVEATTVTFIGEHGLLLVYPHPQPDHPVMPSNGGQRFTLARTDTGGYQVYDPDRELTWHFDPDPVLRGLDTRLGNYAITAVTDRHDNRIGFHYNSDGAPSEITHTGGYRVRVTTADDRITALAVIGAADSDNEIVSYIRRFEYQAGELVAVTNGSGAVTRFAYDDAHRMLSWTDSNGNSMLNTYDTDGRVVAQHGNSDVLNATFDYFTFPDGTGSRTVHTDSLGAQTTYVFDNDLRLVEHIDPVGARTRTDYNDLRHPTRVIAPDGAITTYHYADDAATLTAITRPDGARIEITHHSPNRPATVTDVDGSTRHQEWDDYGNLIATVDHACLRTEYTHHPTGAVATVTEPTGATTEIETDPAGLPTRITDPHGSTTTIERDHFGRPVAVTDPLGTTTRYTWSGESKLQRRTDPDGHHETWAYDGENNLIAHVDRAGHITRYLYGTFDLLTQRTDPDGAVTRYEWDTQRRLTAVHNPIGDTWHYTYDPAGRLAGETDYNGAATTYTYDAAGRVATLTPATGVTRYRTHDALGHLTHIYADTGEWLH